MIEPHLTSADAEQYILGALDPERERKLEAHTLVCEVCARLVQHEAMLEEHLREVASSAPREANVLRPARWRVAAMVVGPALAAAAALTLMVFSPVEPSSQPRPEGAVVLSVELPVELPAELPSMLVACPDLTTQESCTKAAAARGLLIQYPLGMGEVPRYEGNLELAAGTLAARPAPL